MPKTVSLPPVRVEPEMLEQVQRLSVALDVSVYELTRMAVLAYVRRYDKSFVLAPALDDADQLGVIPA